MPSTVDLFCGMGGISYGFKKTGFSITGYDTEKWSEEIFSINKIGNVKNFNLKNVNVDKKTGLINLASRIDEDFDADVIVGGPPCRPWSLVNLTKRNKSHPDYGLIESFFRIINKNEPSAFLMENVPPVKNDPYYLRCIKNIERKYSTQNMIIGYDQFGAATKRTRLITVGFKNCSAGKFFSLLSEYKQDPVTVGEAINDVQNFPRGYNDHEWPNLKTIHKYDKYYETGKYGWYKLKWNEPAPSFGNVMKTYTLHPCGERVVSVREIMCIMGFPINFVFPPKMGHTKKYQMIADAVSPKFSEVSAQIIKELIL